MSKTKISITIEEEINNLLKEEMRLKNISKSSIIENALKSHYLAKVLLGNIDNE